MTSSLFLSFLLSFFFPIDASVLHQMGYSPPIQPAFHSSLLHSARHLLHLPYKHKTIIVRGSYLSASLVTTRLNLCL